MALFPNYNRFDLAVKSANGTTITDVNDKTYLDFGSGIGVCNLGHRHEAVQKAVETQLDLYWHVSNLYHNPIQEDVAQLITENSAGDNVFFCNSGAEANEAAIKLARRATGKEKVISFQQSFHGRTFATMAATGQDKVRDGFGPMLQSFAYANYNDIDSVKSLIDKNTAAVMIEVVQGEGGVIPATETFIKELAALCEAEGLLLIIDEIQTGIGRTGAKLAHQHYGIEPDIFTLAKGLGNGLPVGATVAKKDIAEKFGPGTHGSTFGGNPVAMSAAKAVLNIVFDDAFLQDVTERSDYLIEQLNKELADVSFVKNIRGKGFMLGIECEDKVAPIMKDLMADGLIVLNAGDNVLRLLPPLTVTKAEIDQAVSMIKAAIEKIK